MIEYLNTYASNIVFFLLLMVFLKMFLNNKKYVNYIDVILGFLLILILIEPITKVFSMENIDFKVLQEEQVNIEEYMSMGDDYISSMSAKTMKKQIEGLLVDYDYEIYDTTISFDEEYNLKSINIILEDSTIFEVSVDQINIEGQGAVVESLEILEIKNLVKDFYNLSLSHINVWIK